MHGYDIYFKRKGYPLGWKFRTKHDSSNSVVEVSSEAFASMHVTSGCSTPCSSSNEQVNRYAMLSKESLEHIAQISAKDPKIEVKVNVACIF